MPIDDGIDPRTAAIADRLAGVRRVIGVTGSKGGIGKSVVASLLALWLADTGKAVGLFDLDFTSPTDHVVLGVESGFPTETFGIDPPSAHGVRMMSIAFFSGDAPAPMRGSDATGALLELLAITRWGELDVLVLDMPPGLGDTSLDVLRYVPDVEFLLVANSSRMVVDSVRRAVALLTELRVPVIGLLETMQRTMAPLVAELADQFAVPYLGALPYDVGLEAALGDVAKLRATSVYTALRRVGPSMAG